MRKLITSLLVITSLVFSVAASQTVFANGADALIKERISGFKKSKK